MKSISLKFAGYRLTTAEILYRLPDHPHLLQSYVWQEFDLAPDFPMLRKFLDFWKRSLDGEVHSVRLAHAPLLAPTRMRHVRHSFAMH